MAALALPVKRQSTLASPMALPLPLQPLASSSKPPMLRRLSSSPEPDDEDEDNDEEGGGGKKRKAAAAAAAAASGNKKGPSAIPTPEYRYSTEIAQMMFVFGEVQDPLMETVRLVEDVVRGQVIEIVTRARLLSHIRNSRFLSAEDLIFLIRDDRGKVNRLRTYLSWKDVRKRAKDDNGADAGDVVEDLGEVGNDKAALKTRKPIIKLPWELMTSFTDFLRSLPSQPGQGGEEEDEEDEDEMQAYEDSIQRLRDADAATRRMTREEYVHYSECRQASFTYRKARRFRDFVNFTAYLDVRPNDDIIDVLGFLSFEMVRSLCVTALEVRAQLSDSSPENKDVGINRSPTKRPASAIQLEPSTPSKRAKGDGTGQADAQPVHEPEPVAETFTSLFAPPPSARAPLLPSHILEAFARIQRAQANHRVGGMRNWRGGVSRAKVALV